MSNLKEYYSKRAKEYEQIYQRADPEIQSELPKINNLIHNSFRNKSLLEIAFGTGYWTKVVVQTAISITAIDYSSEMIERAKSKNINASFIIDDAYSINNVNGNFNAGLANFWISHIPKNKIHSFLNTFHNKLQSGSTIIMVDNIFVKDFGGEVIKKNDKENTYKLRALNDGTTYQILKNYYNQAELNTIFKEHSSEIKIHFGNFYWWIKYKLN